MAIYLFCIALFYSVTLNAQDKETDRAMSKLHRHAVGLKRAGKAPLKAKKIFISSYKDTVFPTEDLMQFVNAEQFILNGNYEMVNDTFRFHSLRIDTTRLKKFKQLVCLSLVEFDLSGRFPAELFCFTQLKGLSVSLCNLDELPPGILRLQELTYLELRLNNLDHLPDEVFRLPKLEVLDLCNNKFTTLPLNVPYLRSLQKLYLSNVESVRATDAYISKININQIDYKVQYPLLRTILSGSSHPFVAISVPQCSDKKELVDELIKEDLYGSVFISAKGCD